MSMRDLGGHLCLGARLCGTTVNKRLAKATDLCNALCHRPWSRESKIKIVNTLVLATGLYGAEAAPPAERPLAKLSTSLAKAIGPHSADSSNTMAFHTATTFALEPGCQILLRRIALARRIFAKHPWTIEVFMRSIASYEKMGFLGAIANGSTAPHMEPCPPCGAAGRGKWTSQSHRASGPVGLLITSLAEHCGNIRPDLTISGPAHLSFHLVHIPYQHIRPMVDAFATESHATFLAANRSAFQQMASFDKDTHRAAIAKLTPSAKSFVLSAQCLAMSSAAKRLRYFGMGDGACPFCGSASSGTIHETWECQAFAAVQNAEDNFLSVLGPHNLPSHTLLGVPEQLDPGYSDAILKLLPAGGSHLLSRPVF